MQFTITMTFDAYAGSYEGTGKPNEGQSDRQTLARRYAERKTRLIGMTSTCRYTCRIVGIGQFIATHTLTVAHLLYPGLGLALGVELHGCAMCSAA